MSLIVYQAFLKLKAYTGWEIGYFWLGLALQLVNSKRFLSIFQLRTQYPSSIRARTVFKGEPIDIGREFLRSYPYVDPMVDESREISRDDQSHTFVTSETLDLPGDFVTVRSFMPKRYRRMQTYWGLDKDGTYYIVRQTDPSTKLRSQTIKEALVCVPISGGSKTMVYFFSDFNYI